MQFGLIEAVRHWGLYRRKKAALVSNGQETTYADLFAASEGVAAAIIDLGVEGRVAIAAHSKRSFLIALLGAMRAGRSAVVLNPRLADDVLGVTVADTEPTILLQDRALANTWKSDALTRLRRVTVDELEDHPRADVPWPDYSSDTEWGIVFSSGSTGVPKGIAEPRTWSNHCRDSRASESAKGSFQVKQTRTRELRTVAIIITQVTSPMISMSLSRAYRWTPAKPSQNRALA
jgi:acyl-CoA synthetase (AMP-forming)/AMP-acid ligase II